MNPTPTPGSPAPVDIQRQRELEAKATPGPLIVDFGEVIRIKDSRGGTIANLTHLDHKGRRRDANEVEANATFIAALWNNAPALLDEVERLREQVKCLVHNWQGQITRTNAERDKLREKVEISKECNQLLNGALDIAKANLDFLRQQNEQLLKEIEELKSRPTGLWKENY